MIHIENKPGLIGLIGLIGCSQASNEHVPVYVPITFIMDNTVGEYIRTNDYLNDVPPKSGYFNVSEGSIEPCPDPSHET